MSALFKTLRQLFVPHPHNNHQAHLWQVQGLTMIAILSLAFPLSIATVPARQGSVLGYTSVITSDAIIKLTNEERIKNGLSSLEENATLSQAAADKAQDMFANNYWAHVSPSGVQPWDFISKAGYQYLYAGENLARDFIDTPSVIQAWMDSPTHRDNLLNTHYTQIGIAVAEGKINGYQTTLVVQEFGSPRIIGNTTLGQVGSDNAGASTVKSINIKVPVSTPIQKIPTDNIPLAAPLDITKAWTIAIGTLMIVVLSIDIVVMNTKRIPRLASRPVAHLLFVLTMLIGIWYTQAGFIK